MIRYLIFLLTLTRLSGQVEVVILNEKVGSEIDIHENRFYRIFPDVDNFLNAQISKLKIPSEGYLSYDEKRYKIKITIKSPSGKKSTIKRIISQKEFNEMSYHVNEQEIFTEKRKIEMYEGMDYLRSEKIVSSIPKPQFVKLKHGNKRGVLKGTLTMFENNILHIQTPTTIEKISLSDLDFLSYRDTIKIYPRLRFYTYGITSFVGLLSARRFNDQRELLYNKNNIPRKDIFAYTQIMGIVIGLIFSSEVFDAMSTLLTPTKSIILSKSAYEEKNYK